MEQNRTALNYIDMDKFEPNSTKTIDELNVCLVNYYERECCIYGLEFEKICVNGLNTLDENFADLFGEFKFYRELNFDFKKFLKIYFGLYPMHSGSG